MGEGKGGCDGEGGVGAVFHIRASQCHGVGVKICHINISQTAGVHPI